MRELYESKIILRQKSILIDYIIGLSLKTVKMFYFHYMLLGHPVFKYTYNAY